MLRNAVGGVTFSRKNINYKGVWFNVISVTTGLGCQFSRKKCYVTLE